MYVPFSQTEKDDNVKDYFNTLPSYLQENIMQSGYVANSVEDLRKYAENMIKGQGML